MGGDLSFHLAYAEANEDMRSASQYLAHLDVFARQS